MNSVFSRSAAAALAAALLATLPLGSAALPAAAILPVDWSLTPTRIAQSCAAGIAAVRRGSLAVAKVAAGKRTFDSVVLPLETATASFNDDLAAQGFLYNVSPDAKVRAASLKCSTDAGNVLTEISARPDIYRAVADAKASGTARGAAQVKLTDLWLTALQRSGAGLPNAQRAEFVALSQKLTELQNRFGANLGDDTSTIAISAAQAKSLPASFVSGALKPSAGGGFTVPVNESTIGPFLQNQTDPAARKAFYIAYNNRGGETNLALLQGAIAARDRLAHLIGYPSWAAFVLADRMAASPARVEGFLSQIDAAILPKARQERDEDAALAKADGKTTFDQWDQACY